MATDQQGESETTLSPEEAFDVLGEQARLEVLRALGTADEPLAFSELFDRIAYDDYSNFGYHLEKLVGHFVRKTDAGYDLQEAGRRVVEAVLSGAVTETPVVEPAETGQACPFCGAPVEAGFQHGRVEMHCTGCPGFLRFADSGDRRFTERGSLGFFYFPPAGVRDRSPTEVFEAAWTWQHVDFVANASGVCSRCGATLSVTATVCEDHDATEGCCEACGRRFATRFDARCRNCDYAPTTIAPGVLLSNTDLLAFLTVRGVNPLVPGADPRALAALVDYDEEVHSTDPYRASFTFEVDGDAITLTLDDTLSVVDVAVDAGPGSGP